MDRLFLIVGKHSFQQKDQLKELGCVWHPEHRAWSTNSSHLAKLAVHKLIGLRIEEVISDCGTDRKAAKKR